MDAGKDLFGLRVGVWLEGKLGGVGTSGRVPTPRIGVVGQALPELPLTTRRASYLSSEGQSIRAEGEDVHI